MNFSGLRKNKYKIFPYAILLNKVIQYENKMYKTKIHENKIHK